MLCDRRAHVKNAETPPLYMLYATFILLFATSERYVLIFPDTSQSDDPTKCEISTKGGME